MKNLLLLTLLSTLFLSSCAVGKQDNWLSEHQSLLTNAMSKSASPQQKLDAVASSFTTAMHQSLNHLNPKKAVQYLNRYSDQNSELIDVLLGDIKTWQKGMSTMETVALGISVAQQPYFKDFIELFPRFQNKFNQLNTIMGLGGKLKKGLLGFGADKLLDQGTKMMNK